MEIAVHPKQEIAEALAYQNCWGLQSGYGDDWAAVDVRVRAVVLVDFNCVDFRHLCYSQVRSSR